MRRARAIALTALLACACGGGAAAITPAAAPAGPHPDAPPETAQLAPLIGRWHVTGESMQPDGTWQTNRPAEWRWYYILDGYAVQDDYVSPPTGVEAAPGTRTYGTNVRMYDSAAGAWKMAWVSNGRDTLATFTARMQDGQLVMEGRYKDRFDTRNVFYDIARESFRWKKLLLLPGDDGERWVEVARLEARRID